MGIRQVALLPKDPDGSARAIRDEIRQRTGKNLPSLSAIVSAVPGESVRSTSRWGVSGLKSIKDERGLTDRYGYQLKAAVAAVADEIAAAAELVMGKRDGVPVVIVRGCEIDKEEGSVKELLRPEAEDLFRHF